MIAGERKRPMNLCDFPERHFLGQADELGLWERFQFNRLRDGDGECGDAFEMNGFEFVARKDGVLGGLLSFVEIYVDREEGLTLSNRPGQRNCMWASKLMILDNELKVGQGDKICVSAWTSANSQCQIC